MERRHSTTSDSSTDSNRQLSENGETTVVGRGAKITGPKPPPNALQFVKTKPADLYRSAQEQLRKVEEIKKAKKEVKDEAEDWQSNLDSWKFSRRKMHEHIIERVVEVKKYEQEEHERNRRRSKTFNEMMQDRGTRGRKSSVPVYQDDESNDLSDLGLGSHQEKEEEEENKEDLPKIAEVEEYTYERAIQSYVNFAETRVKGRLNQTEEEKPVQNGIAKKIPSPKIENSISALERRNSESPPKKTDLPKVDISKRKELFEKTPETTEIKKERSEVKINQVSVRDRLSNIEKIAKGSSVTSPETTKPPVLETSISIKDRLSSLQASVKKEDDLPMYRSLDSLDTEDTDREDSGIHTADVSSSVSQADEFEDIKSHPERVTEEPEPEPVPSPEPQEPVVCKSPSPEPEAQPEVEEVQWNGLSELEPKSQDLFVETTEEVLIETIEPATFTPLQNLCLVMDQEVDSVFQLSPSSMEPPKEKPPPPPLDMSDDDEEEELEPPPPKNTSLRRLDSTKRIKKEIRQKRSSFLGIEGANESYLDPELELIRPPDMTTLLAEERRMERQLYRQSVCSESDSNQESRDSGVELDPKATDLAWNHSRNGSETFGNQSTTSEEEEMIRKEREIIEALEQEEKIRKQDLEKLAIRLRQLEAEKGREEWERFQHQNEVIRAHQPISPTDERPEQQIQAHQNSDGPTLGEPNQEPLLQEEWYDVPRSSMPDIPFIVEEFPVPREAYRNSLGDLRPEHRSQRPVHGRSMPDLQAEFQQHQQPPQPRRPPPPLPVKPSQSCPQQMSRQTLHALSAAPRSKIITNDNWQAKRKPKQDNYNYQHWLIQEAEHRRITEHQQRQNPSVPRQNGTMKPPWGPPNSQYAPHVHQPTYTTSIPPPGSSPNRDSKPLPDSIIHTLTQRVQSRINLNDPNNNRRRLEEMGGERMLSVSGKKRCSHCGEELGRGAAMIIESLRLFYHIDCFKCCVCCVQLGNGLMGTDVRVRNNKLHCHNCYSSDDGVKFSCV